MGTTQARRPVNVRKLMGTEGSCGRLESVSAARRAVGCFLLLALLGTGAAGAALDGREVLVRSLEREGQVDYEGLQATVVSWGRGRESRTEQIVKFKRPNRLRIEYLAPPRLKGDVVVDDGTRLRRFVRALGIVEEGPSPPRGFSGRQRPELERALRRGALSVSLEGEETVAGRRAWVVTLAPRAPGRPGRKLWLDQEHGLPLRVRQTGPGGRVTDTFFQRITFGVTLDDREFVLEAPEGTPVVPRARGRAVSLPEAEKIAEQHWGRLYQIRSLPPGIALRSVRLLELDGKPVLHLRYGNGRRGFSLFQSEGPGPRRETLSEWAAGKEDPPPTAGRPHPPAPEGRPRAWGRPLVLELSKGRARLTLIGPPGAARLRALAESIE